MGNNKKKRKNAAGRKAQPESVLLSAAAWKPEPIPPPSDDAGAAGPVDGAVPESAPVAAKAAAQPTLGGDEGEVGPPSPAGGGGNDEPPAAEEPLPSDQISAAAGAAAAAPLVTDEGAADGGVTEDETPADGAGPELESQGPVEAEGRPIEQDEAGPSSGEQIEDETKCEGTAPVGDEQEPPVEGTESSDGVPKPEQETAYIQTDEEGKEASKPEELEPPQAHETTETLPSVVSSETSGKAESTETLPSVVSSENSGKAELSVEPEEETSVEPLQIELEEEDTSNAVVIVEANAEEEVLKVQHQPPCEEVDTATEVFTLPSGGENEVVAELGVEENPSDELMSPAQEAELKDGDVTVQDEGPLADPKQDIILEKAASDVVHTDDLAPIETVVQPDDLAPIETVVKPDDLAPPASVGRTIDTEDVALPGQHSAATNGTRPEEQNVVLGPEIGIPSPAQGEEIVDTPTRPTGMTFSTAFSPDQSEQVPSNATPTSSRMSFAQAFGSDEKAVATVVPAIVESKGSELVMPPSIEHQVSSNGSFERIIVQRASSSHSALSAARNKRVSGLVSKYISEVAKEPLPGDSIPIRKNSSASLLPSPRPSPTSAQSSKQSFIPQIELSTLPDINTVREKFEETSRSTGSTPVFEFGESFRQKQRYELLSDKEREREARATLHGFDEKEINNGRTATGEIDTANLAKTYTFELSSIESIELHDGSCKVDYKNVDYKTMVFVVHRTRGMLLLHCNVKDGGKNNKKPSKSSGKRKCQIPGGSVLEEEFLRAAKQSGSSQVQLQIAAREAAARQLFENTGLDVRKYVDRFKPAVLRLNPPVDARGVQYLKNENDNMLYYFLQVDEDDFVCQTTGEANEKLTRPSEDPGDSPLTLRLCPDFDGFTFVHDPADAAKILRKDGDDQATIALRMIMNEASGETQGGAPAGGARSSETVSRGDSVPADERSGTLRVGRIRTVGDGQSEEKKTNTGGNAQPELQEGKPGLAGDGGMFHHEAALIIKSPSDSQEAPQVGCCCGWW